MKSILVEALRSANDSESEKNLSDSGSFDATHEDFTATANQDVIDAAFGEDAEELELMSTTSGLIVADEQASEPPEFDETIADGTVLLTASDYIVHDHSTLPPMPQLARHVPLLCLALAVLAATGWFAYQRLELHREASSLGVFAIPASDTADSDEQALADGNEQRFRYLNKALPTSDNEGAQ